MQSKAVVHRIERFLQDVMEGSTELRTAFGATLKEWRNPDFDESCFKNDVIHTVHS